MNIYMYIYTYIIFVRVHTHMHLLMCTHKYTYTAMYAGTQQGGMPVKLGSSTPFRKAAQVCCLGRGKRGHVYVHFSLWGGYD